MRRRLVLNIDPGLATLIAAGIALLGVIVGSLLSQLFEWLRLGRESKLRQKEKIMERRIAAHEKAMLLADSMSTMAPVSDQMPLVSGELTRSPIILFDKEGFESWFAQELSVTMKISVWLSRPACRELYFIQDYMINLLRIANKLDVNEWNTLGNNVRNDVLEMSNNLRDNAVDFLKADAINLKMKDLNKWHKYKPDQTIDRLNQTEMIKKYGHLIS